MSSGARAAVGCGVLGAILVWIDLSLGLGLFAAAVVAWLLDDPADPRAEGERTLPAADPAEADPEARREALYALAEGLDGYVQRCAVVEDLRAHPHFVRAVDLLDHPSVARSAVLEYACGSNFLLTCAACEALARHPDAPDAPAAVEALLETLETRAYWARWFYFRALDALAPDALLPRLLAGLDPEAWEAAWVRRPLREFLAARLAREGVPDAGDLLARIRPERRAGVIELLAGVSGEAAAALTRGLREATPPGPTPEPTPEAGREARPLGRAWSATDARGALPTPAVDAAVGAALAALGAPRRRSVLFVGPPGVGKTSAVRVLAQRLLREGWDLFEADAGELLAGQSYLGQLEEQVKALLRRLAGRRTLWIVPQFHQLAWAGRHRYSPTGVLEMILPALEAGEVLLVGETRPEGLEALLAERPTLRSALETVAIEPLDRTGTLALARRWLAQQKPAAEAAPGVLEEAHELAEQYLRTLAAPGHLLTLLASALTPERRSAPTAPLSRPALLRALAELTGLPDAILDERHELDVARLRAHFDARVIGQPEAVQCLVERVALIKAGLTDPCRPLGVFLFAGPTGTGKTELARALAAWLFGSEERLLRLDMSEFQGSGALDRILGEGQPGPRRAGLVDRIRQQPFSVVLLDEFEKADPAVWNLFLQVFDAGRLTDPAGNTADFRHSILILTSNVGSEASTLGRVGFGGGPAGARSPDLDAALKATFSPEFLNRLDRVLAFRPLSLGVMRRILHKELALVLKRRGLRTRSWAVEWEDSALDFLLERGFDPALGARPLRRAIERHLLAPLALTIADRRVPQGDQFLFVRSNGARLEVAFVDPDAPPGEPAVRAIPPGPSTAPAPDARALALDCQGTRAELEALTQRLALLRAVVDAPAWQAARDAGLGQMSAAGFWERADRFAHMGRVEYRDRVEAAVRRVGSLLARLAGGGPGRAPDAVPPDLLRSAAGRIYLLEAAVADLEAGRAADAYLAVEAAPDAGGGAATAASDAFARRLARMYRRWAESRGMRMEVLRETPGEAHQAFAFVAAVSGFAAHAILAPESGLHLLEQPQGEGRPQRVRARVLVAGQAAEPEAAGARQRLEQALGALEAVRGAAGIVRRYQDAPTPLVRDRVRGWRTGRAERVWEGDFDLFGPDAG